MSASRWEEVTLSDKSGALPRRGSAGGGGGRRLELRSLRRRDVRATGEDVEGAFGLRDREGGLLGEQHTGLDLLGLGRHLHEVHRDVAHVVAHGRVDPDLDRLGRRAGERCDDVGGVGHRLALGLEVQREGPARPLVGRDVAERDVDELARERDARDEDPGGDRALLDRQATRVLTVTVEGLLDPGGLGGVETRGLRRELDVGAVLDPEAGDELVGELIARPEDHPDATGGADHHGGGADRRVGRERDGGNGAEGGVGAVGVGQCTAP